MPRTSSGSVAGPQVFHLLEGFRSRGLDPESLCRSVRLDWAGLLHASTRVPWTTARALLDTAERLSNDPLAGLHAAHAVGARGVIAYLARAQPTVEQAIEQLVRYVRITVDDAEARFEWRNDLGVLRLVLGPGEPAVERHPREYLTALIVLEFTESSRGRFRPHGIRFPHAPGGDPREYEAILHCPVRFRCSELEIVITEEMLATRLRTHSPDVAPLLEDEARRELALVTSVELSPRINAALRRALERGEETSADSIAAQLGLSVRTLQRRLEEEGSSFRAALDRARCERARKRLSEPNVSISCIADELGFADVAAFSKAFRRWTGTPPSALRRKTRG